jgi:sugar phosphate isomerase/epimerase
MITFTRRHLLASALAPSNAGLRIGVMDGIMRLTSKPESVLKAKELGFEGLQVTFGQTNAPFRDDATLALKFRDQSKAAGLPIVSTYIDTLHKFCLKQDREAVAYASEAIKLTRGMGAPILMLVFFGKCALVTEGEMEAVVAPLKELCREAERAKITLGFENTLPAADALRVLDKVKSRALKIYYDIGNATNLYKENPAEAIRAIGRDRICQFHFKDKGYLGEGAVDVRSALDAIHAIGWRGYIVLETGAPSGDPAADLKRNLTYLRGL